MCYGTWYVLFVLLLFPLHFCDYFYFLFCFFLTYFNSWYPCSTLAPLACSLMYYYCYYLLQSRVGHNILSSNDEIFCFPFISRPWLPFFSSLFFLLVLQCVSVYLVLLFFFFLSSSLKNVNLFCVRYFRGAPLAAEGPQPFSARFGIFCTLNIFVYVC